MRIHLPDIWGHQLSDINYLKDSIIRFKFKKNPKVLTLYKMILEGDNDTSKLFPDAPNRDAVEYNFQRSKEAFQNFYEKYKKEYNLEIVSRKQIIKNDKCLKKSNPAEVLPLKFYLLRSGKLRAFKDVLHLNIMHCFQPDFIYYNGQKYLTLVKKQDKYEMFEHDNFKDFFSEYNRHITLKLESYLVFDSLDVAEYRIIRELSRLEIQKYVAFKEKQTKDITVQPTENSLIISCDGKETQKNKELEGYQIINEFEEEFNGFKFKACGTCKNFMFSGISRDMGHGNCGYCAVREDRKDKDSGVNVFDICSYYVYISDKKRKMPYLRKNQNSKKMKKMDILLKHVMGYDAP